MNKEYNLSLVGIDKLLNLSGKIEILYCLKGLPIVFLFDEEHNNDKCAENNIANAIELILKAKVEVIGVESHFGGRFWDKSENAYDDDEPYDEGKKELPKNDYPYFADRLRNKYKDYIFGVESFEIASSFELDAKGDTTSPLNLMRTEHMVLTLFEHRTRINSNGNLILNCGQNHINHIETWIRNGEIEAIARFKASYLRINTID